ncbi:MAG: serine/threonine protein kinase, partial [Opitutus sp.]|nr:serine/threonine protein kinase [Opitutus sp.]
MNDSHLDDEALLAAALERSGAERAGFLDGASAGDSTRRARIDRLIRAHDAAQGAAAGGGPAVAAVRSDDTRVTRATPRTEEAIGDVIGRYKLLEQLGEGGCGVVYLADQEEPVRRRVALKIIKLGMDTKEVIARFEIERQVVAMMDHPNIAKVFDAGTTESGRPFFVMELVRGVPITKYCDEKNLTTAARLGLFQQVCHAVQHAHQKGIIHRDLKPSNILVALHDDAPVPKVIDFGIAKATGGRITNETAFTAVGQFIGTPAYMSPEQAQLSGVDIDTRSDIYSLGVLLYELLTGRTPFDTAELLKTGLDEMRRHIREVEPIRPSTRIRTLQGESLDATAQHRQIGPLKLIDLVRGDLDWIVMRCLEKDRARRYETANGLARDVERHLKHEPVSAGPPSATYRARKFVRRHRVGVVFGAGLFVLLAVFAVVTATQARRIAQQRDRANQEAAAAKQVSDFLVGLFKVSDPSEARGKTLTAREILTTGAKKIESSLRDQPRVQARLEATIGAVYMGLGLYADAQPLLDRALQSQRRILGDDSVETLTTANTLGDVYWYQQNYPEAERLYRDLVQRRTRVLGEEHADTLKANYDLASLYLKQNRWDEAERLSLKTLGVQTRVLGKEHPATLGSMNNLQAFYFQQGRFSEAAPIATEVFEARHRILGEDHPDTLNARHNLASLCVALGRFSEAEKHYAKTLEGKRRVLGPEHPSTLLSMHMMANAYAAHGKYGEAATLQTQTLALRKRVRGAEHPDTLASMNQLAGAYRAQGKLAESEALLRDVLIIREKNLPDEWLTQLCSAELMLPERPRAAAADFPGFLGVFRELPPSAAFERAIGPKLR